VTLRSSLLASLLPTFAVTALLLLGLEGLARFREGKRPAPPVADYIWDWTGKMEGDFYTMRSEAVGWPPWEEFNRDGLRDRRHPMEKPEGFRRVVVLGDSVTLGDGMRPYEAFPQVLESRLRAEGQRIEVLNVALWGWSTRQERIAYARIARKYRPDEVVLAVCLNDIPELQNNLSRPPRLLAMLHEHSALVRRLVNAQGREIGRVEELFLDHASPRVREAMTRFFAEVRTLRSEVRADGAGFTMIVFPFRFQVEAGAPAATVQQEIMSFCSAEGLRCLDLLPAFQMAGASAFLDYDHLSPVGAVLTVDSIRASDLLPSGPSDTEILRTRLGPSQAVVAALVEALSDTDPVMRAAAAYGLTSIGPAASAAAPRLAAALRADGAEAVRSAAARALGALGAGAKAGVPALFEALTDPREGVRWSAAEALSKMDLAAPGAVAPLAAALRSPDSYVRGFAAWTLGNLGSVARDAVPALVQALGEREGAPAVEAALARIGPAAAEAVPALLLDLKHKDGGRRWRAARTLGRLGPAARAAVPGLIEALHDPEEMVRAHAARALGRMGPEARPAAAALQRATGDPDESVRQEARGALDKLH
jgi:HEAT repeat protein/lysophospholipase L1-like esterase